MRKNAEKHMPLSPCWPEHQMAEDLRVISKILDDNLPIQDLVLQDLSDKKREDTGAPGTKKNTVPCGGPLWRPPGARPLFGRCATAFHDTSVRLPL